MRAFSEENNYGVIFIEGSDAWQNDAAERYFIIYRGCLSFICCRVGITPQDLWESLFQPPSGSFPYAVMDKGSLYCVEYYGMDGHNEQQFGYAVEQQTLREDGSGCADRWSDPDSMEDTAWILRRPTVLPIPAPNHIQALAVVASPVEYMAVFDIPELFNLVLLSIVELRPEDAAREPKADNHFNSPPLISAAKTILALSQVNHFFHNAILTHCQGLFVLLIFQYGWMLPSTPGDWIEWRTRSGPEPLDLRLEQSLDWRAYVLRCLRRENMAVMNRWHLLYGGAIWSRKDHCRTPVSEVECWSLAIA
ncbi:hypothetical protein C8F04DRAFT_1250226 [Mycena alexandri]|uniref:Uncharacterized protein n=1 Tax=Mycena alexandri TaxID=1745969 RepID=A0AAD6THD4_9AGAR|nr:hypothetical protein C8F04DRAFT_1250226 [Mycena alexandri]